METITAKEVQELVEQGTSLIIIDVREVKEVAEVKIPGVVNIPLGLLEFKMNELDKSKEYIMVCRSRGRSGKACQFLENHGFTVINMTGGMLAWEGETV
ncbi:rhodanese-like domain-containing protein [Peribacillus glennii]|uniref:Rhodanese-like domain-containing protein n=1 Tax=Peribacillus glennii TaxID=2303991 RepID=A0A372LF24_9BACI|nr:rhodanese-like domain-containing protein [Peribacillus glennii]RFU64679.1 rhodanese-like domain-containing protein [Peribacillus glennii]